MAPPKGGSGPRGMAAGLVNPQRGAGGDETASTVSAQELIGGYQALFGHYSQVEANQRLKADTESKLALMVDKINGGQLPPATLEKLQTIMLRIQEGNGPAAQAAFREATTKCWGDVKDFANALKLLAAFKQKYGQ